MRYAPTLLALLVLAALPGCDLVDGGDADTVYGRSVAIGDGTARTYIRFGGDQTPLAVGVALSPGALDGLPDHYDHPEEAALILPLPVRPDLIDLPFSHVNFAWVPHGHGPEGLFTVPHFDVHFNIPPLSEIMTWTPADPTFAEKGERAPEPRYVPEGYVLPPGPAVPAMGNHLIDTTDPTYAPDGPGFTEVLIWGSYDGAIAFIEPMMTRAYLETRPDHTEPVAQPEAFAVAGYYPTTYRVAYDADTNQYIIELGGLVMREAS